MLEIDNNHYNDHSNHKLRGIGASYILIVVLFILLVCIVFFYFDFIIKESIKETLLDHSLKK